MSKLRAAISFKHRVDEVKAIQQQTIRQESNPENSDSIQDDNSDNIQDDDSDKESEDYDETQVSLNWNNLINTWEQLLLQEEEAELESLDDNDYDVEINEILLNRTHSALDNQAKWNIVDIFIDNLDAPFFINENTSN